MRQLNSDLDIHMGELNTVSHRPTTNGTIREDTNSGTGKVEGVVVVGAYRETTKEIPVCFRVCPGIHVKPRDDCTDRNTTRAGQVCEYDWARRITGAKRTGLRKTEELKVDGGINGLPGAYHSEKIMCWPTRIKSLPGPYPSEKIMYWPTRTKSLPGPYPSEKIMSWPT